MNRRPKIILLVISLPIIIYLWPSALGGDAEFMMVQGESMLPTILPGSFVITKEAPLYEIDDIVAFLQKEGGLKKIVVHRIIDETPQGFTIKGDNNPRKDPGFPTEDVILGKVVFATPYVGDVLSSLRNPFVLISSAVVMVALQMEQDRRKKRKEKIRRIRLGITKKSSTILEQKSKKKSKKPNYSLFFAAIAFNIFTYVALQISIGSNIKQEGDVVTGFLFNIFESSLVSTVTFALYFLFIAGLYFLAKIYEVKSNRTKIIRKKSKTSIRLFVGKDANPMLAVAQFLWILFILMSIFHLLTIFGDLLAVL